MQTAAEILERNAWYFPDREDLAPREVLYMMRDSQAKIL